MVTSSHEARAFEVIRANTVEVVPTISPDMIQIGGRLADYGCNSLDRSDIVWKTMLDLEIDVPVEQLAGIADIAGLTRVLAVHMEARGRGQ